MSNSNVHNHFPLPTLVAGGGAGQLKGGRHLKYPDHTPMANLLVDGAGEVRHPDGEPRGQHGCAGESVSAGPLYRVFCAGGDCFSALCKLVDAVKTGDKTTALTLLQQKADVNSPEPDGTTAIMWAVRQNDLAKWRTG